MNIRVENHQRFHFEIRKNALSSDIVSSRENLETKNRTLRIASECIRKRRYMQNGSSVNTFANFEMPKNVDILDVGQHGRTTPPEEVP